MKSKIVITWLLIILQSCGIHFFSGQGTMLMVIVCGLWAANILKLKKDLTALFIITAFLLLNYAVNENADLSKTLYQLGLVIEVMLFLKAAPMDELYTALLIVFIHAGVGYLLYIIAPHLFVPVSLGYGYETCLHLLYVADVKNVGIRNTGMLWEPGLLQLMLNMLLFFAIQKSKSLWLMALIVACIITTQSTTGYIILILNAVYYVLKSRKRWLVIACILIAIPSLTFIIQNIQDKTSGQNISGLARYRDYLIGIELIKEKPLLGHSIFNSKYLLSKKYVTAYESQLFTKEYVRTVQAMNGGYTNGLLGFFAWYGIPAALLTFFLTFKNRIIEVKMYERTIFFLLLCFTLISEPISYTSFFLMFPLSVIVKTSK